MQSGLSGGGLVLPVIVVREGERDQLPKRRPDEGDDGGIRRPDAGGGKPLPVECCPRDRILKAVVEAMDEDQQITSRIGQILATAWLNRP